MQDVFCGRKGMLVVKFMQKRTTLTSKVYRETLKKTMWGYSEQKAWNSNIQCIAPP
jgi:hypothetical protein